MSNTKPPTQSNKSINNLTPKQNRYAVARINGKTKVESGLIAGAKTPVAASKYAQRMSKNVQVQQAIDNALTAHSLTPELAVGELKKIVMQDEELGAKRLAIKDSLELHGWKRGDKPAITLDIRNASFFNNARPQQDQDQ